MDFLSHINNGKSEYNYDGYDELYELDLIKFR